MAVHDPDSIASLDLTPRMYNALRRNGIRTVAELVALTDGEILRMRFIGPTTLAELRRRLEAAGLSLSTSPADAPGPEAPDAPEPVDVPEAEWIGRQLAALTEDDRVSARNGLGGRWQGEGAALLNRRRAWAWYRWGIDPDAEWPRATDGGFGYMATPLPGSVELHLEGLNRLAREELGS